MIHEILEITALAVDLAGVTVMLFGFAMAVVRRTLFAYFLNQEIQELDLQRA